MELVPYAHIRLLARAQELGGHRRCTRSTRGDCVAWRQYPHRSRMVHRRSWAGDSVPVHGGVVRRVSAHTSALRARALGHGLSAQALGAHCRHGIRCVVRHRVCRRDIALAGVRSRNLRRRLEFAIPMKSIAAIGLLSLLMSIATPLVAAGDTKSEASTQLAKLLDEDLDAVFRRNPLNATTRGVPGYNDKLPESSRASLDKERVREHALLGRLRAIDYASLKGQDRVSYQLLLEKTQTAVEGERFRDADALAISTLGGFQHFMPRAAQVTPFKTAQDYRDYTARLSAMPAYADAIVERMRLGLASGWMSTKPVVERVVGAIDAHLVDDASTSVLMGPFANM